MVSVAERLAEVKRRIKDAAVRSGRAPSSVTLVAVSKTFSVDVVLDAIAAGITDLGENRAQELREKASVIGGARWHFIGHLQSNKARHVVGTAALIHSVDRIGVAEQIARRARSIGIIQDVLVEVNISGEAAKNGVEPPRATSLTAEVAELEGLCVRGLMTMPPWPDDPEDSRPHYRELAGLRDGLAGHVPSATELSMGMTRDFEVAIEEGATLIRVGEAIFGARH